MQPLICCMIWKIVVMFFNLIPMMLVYDIFVVIKVLILRLLTETRNIRIINHMIVHIILVRITRVQSLLPVTGTEGAQTAGLLDLINSIHINMHHVIVIINPRIIMNQFSNWSSVSPNWSSELDCKVRERQLWSPTSSPNRGRDRDKRSHQSLSPRDDRGGEGSKTCLTCGGHGHYYKECPYRPKKPTCYICGEQVILSKNVLIDQDLGQLHLRFVLMIGTLTKTLDNNLLLQVKLFKILRLITTDQCLFRPSFLVMIPLVVMIFSPVFHLLTFSWMIQIWILILVQ